jgi:type II secretory pathway pseudopilin PulG/predicted heme/steroid binding protein
MMKKNKGSALFTSLVVIIMVLGLVLAYFGLAISQNKQTMQGAQVSNVKQIANAGLEMARLALLTGHADKWDDELTTSHNNELSYNPNDTPVNAGTNPALFQWARDISYNDGRYWVIIYDNNDGDGNLFTDKDDKVNVKVKSFISASTINPAIPTESIIIAMLRYKPPLYQPNAAIVSGGDMKISGNPEILGANGTVIVNGNIDIGGNSTIAQDVIATGEINITGIPSIGGDQQEFAPPPDIPPITPSDYYSYRDYRLASNGKVYDTSETMVWDTIASGAYQGWLYDGAGKWTLNGDSAANHTYYIEGNVKISGNPGSAEIPWRTTLIITGYLDISGSPKIAPNEPGTLYIVGKDVKISGANYQQTEQALIAAHEQVNISGTSSYLGSILAEDAEDICSLVTSKSELSMDISGNPTVTYNGSLTTILKAGDPVVIILGRKDEK